MNLQLMFTLINLMQTPVVSFFGRSVHGQGCATVSISGYILFLNFAGYNRDMREISMHVRT